MITAVSVEPGVAPWAFLSVPPKSRPWVFGSLLACRPQADDLVSLSTKCPLLVSQGSSGFEDPDLLTIDAAAARQKRLETGLSTAVRLIYDQIGWSGEALYAPCFYTLTYRPGVDYSPRHITDCLHRIRKWLKRRNHPLLYVWVAEMQKRGVVHYHLCIWWPRELFKGFSREALKAMPKRYRGRGAPKIDQAQVTKDVRCEAAWWPHGRCDRSWAISPYQYMKKYLSKSDSKLRYPPGCRTHSKGGLTGEYRREYSYWRRPGWLREQSDVADRCRPAEGGGWSKNGEVIESPWRIIGIGYSGPIVVRRSVVAETPDLLRRALAFEAHQRKRQCVQDGLDVDYVARTLDIRNGCKGTLQLC